VKTHVILLVAGLSLLLTGCPGSGSQSQRSRNPREARRPVAQRDASRFDDSDKEIQKFDLNGDKVPDVWKVFAKAAGGGADPKLVLVRKEVDVNFDGRVDVWQYFDDKGRIGKDEMDLNFDSRIDVVTYYEKGKVVRREVNAEFDGPPDLFKYYEEGALVRIERDADNDGRIDTWEFYEGGALARVGQDRDGDGQADTWTRR